jgi:hypothetical protein
VPLEGSIHSEIHIPDLTGVFAEQVRAEFANAGSNAVGVRRQVEGTERTHLTPTGDAGVGFDFDHGAVKDRYRFASRPFVAALVER